MAYTTIDDPSEYFHIKLYQGDGSSSLSVTNDANAGNFQPDWLWIKNRAGTYGARSHELMDSSRGANKALESDDNEAESTRSGTNTFNTNGFTVGDDYGVNPPSGTTSVAWQWKAGGTTPTKTYKVVVVSDSGNKYRFRNSGDTATYAASAVTLDLQEGGTYIFDQSDSSNSGHPLRFSTTSNGTHGGGSEYTTGVTTSGTPGSAGAFTQITVAASAPTLYYYCTQHSAMGGQINTNSTHGQTNFDGSILSVVQTNTDAGFSIVTYTGISGGGTAGHGLGTTPVLSIRKSRTSTLDWFYHTTQIDGSMDFLRLNNTDAKSNSGLSAFTSTVIPVDDNTENYVVYVFAEKKGYSKIGSYTGNGNADGTFVYTGFKPAWLLVKLTSGSGENWHLFDSKRSTSNVIKERLIADASSPENANDSILDFVSNGFKFRENNVGWNGNGNTYIYMAFAEHPFVSSKGVPTTAR